MRAWLNSILIFIGATSITDVEYAALNALNLEVDNYNQAAYDELSKILEARESVSDLHDKLVAYFKVKGTDVVSNSIGKSTIYLGSVLQ